MEEYTMFLNWKNKYCQNDCSTQGNLQIQCNSYQITNGVFHKTRTKNLKSCMETQKILKSQCSLDKNEAEKIRLPDFRLYCKGTVIKNENSLRDIWDNIKHTNICIIGVLGEEDTEKGAENILEDIITENFPNFGRKTDFQVQEAQRIPTGSIQSSRLWCINFQLWNKWVMGMKCTVWGI